MRSKSKARTQTRRSGRLHSKGQVTAKPKAPNFLSPEFIEELTTKTEYTYYFEASQSKSRIDGKRRPQLIHKDPSFLAMKELRRRGSVEQFIQFADARPKSDYSKADEETKLASKLLENTIETLRIELDEPLNPEYERWVADFVVKAIKQGDTKALKDFVGKFELLEDKENLAKQNRRKTKRWHWYAGQAALHFLEKGLVPTKGQVRDRALLECARSEFLMDSKISLWPKRIGDKAEQMRHLLPSQRTWTRIFNHLGLSELPESPTHKAPPLN